MLYNPASPLSNREQDAFNIIAETMAQESYYFSQKDTLSYGWIRMGKIQRLVYWIMDFLCLKKQSQHPCLIKTIQHANKYFNDLNDSQKVEQKFTEHFFVEIQGGGFSDSIKRVVKAVEALFGQPILNVSELDILKNQLQEANARTAIFAEDAAKWKSHQEKQLIIQQTSLVDLGKSGALTPCQIGDPGLIEELEKMGVYIHLEEIPGNVIGSGFKNLYFIKELLLRLPSYRYYYFVRFSTPRYIDSSNVFLEWIEKNREHLDSVCILGVVYGIGFSSKTTDFCIDSSFQIKGAFSTPSNATKAGISIQNQKRINVYNILVHDPSSINTQEFVEHNNRVLKLM